MLGQFGFDEARIPAEIIGIVCKSARFRFP
jgi:hypothetical protein